MAKKKAIKNESEEADFTIDEIKELLGGYELERIAKLVEEGYSSGEICIEKDENESISGWWEITDDGITARIWKD